MAIIIEGADCAGKTTYIDEQTQLGDIVIKHRGIPKEMLEHVVDTNWFKCANAVKSYNIIYDIVKQVTHQRVIIDRFQLTDLIYCKHFRQHSFLTEDDLINYCSITDKMIICLPKSPEYQKQLFREHKQVRWEMYDNVDAVIDDFWQVGTTGIFTNDIGPVQYFDFKRYVPVYTYDFTTGITTHIGG